MAKRQTLQLSYGGGGGSGYSIFYRDSSANPEAEKQVLFFQDLWPIHPTSWHSIVEEEMPHVTPADRYHLRNVTGKWSWVRAAAGVDMNPLRGLTVRDLRKCYRYLYETMGDFSLGVDAEELDEMAKRKRKKEEELDPLDTPAREIAHVAWTAEAKARFGEDAMKWRFVCPSCYHIQSVQDYKDAKAPQSAVAFSCVGRWIAGSQEAFLRDKKGPCNYAGGGLIGLNPVTVIMPDGGKQNYFEFAPPEPAPAAAPPAAAPAQGG
jgi:hypothetical protein